jgi:hypothetical protein
LINPRSGAKLRAVTEATKGDAMSVTSELESAERRLARMIHKRADSEEAQARADAATEAQERRDRIRRNADRCAAHQARYDSMFTRFGRRAPLAIADDAPPDYRRKLYSIAQTMLPSGHMLADLDPMELDSQAIVPFEKLLFEALEAESENPSFENLPETVADSRAKLETMDPETGHRRIEWRAKTSFIKEMSMQPRRVLRFIGKNNVVLQGPPFDRVPG